MTTQSESRIDWRLTEGDDGPPEGWRRCTNWIREDGTMDVLYTNAPPIESPYDHDYVFVNYTGVLQKREIGPWVDA